MACDWIKMRTDLYRDPKVCVMADILLDKDSSLSRYVNQNYQRNMTVTRNVMRNAVVGALLSVWGVMRHRGKRIEDNLCCRSVRIAVIDDIADMQGFGDAMAHVGWVLEEDESIVFPSFFSDYNVEPEVKTRSKNADRQRRYRENQKAKSNATHNVTHNVTVTDREEKRREELKESTTPPCGADEDLPDDSPPKEPPVDRSGDGIKILIHDKWQPSEHFDAMLYRSGIKLDPEIKDQIIAEYLSYRIPKRELKTQAEWDHSLLNACIAWKNRNPLALVAGKAKQPPKSALHNFDDVDYSYGVNPDGSF